MSVVICKYLHSCGICLQWNKRKLWQIFANECHWSRDGQIDIDFSKIFAASQDLHVIRVHSFPNAKEKEYFNP